VEGQRERPITEPRHSDRLLLRGADADGVAGRPARDRDAAAAVAQSAGAADEVARDRVAAGAGAGDQDALALVAGNEVAGRAAGSWGQPADGVAGRPAVKANAGPAIGQGGGAVDVGADEVARNDVVGTGAEDENAHALVAGKDV